MYAIVRKIIQKEYISIFILSTSLLISVWTFSNFGLPLLKSNISTQRQIKEYSVLINDSKNNTILKTEILKKQEELEKKHTVLTSGMADASDLSSLLQLIFDKAWKNKIRFDKTTPQAMIETSTSIHYPVILELTTDFNKLGRFVSSLEAMPQIMRVQRLAVTSKSKDSVSAVLQVTCFLSKESAGRAANE